MATGAELEPVVLLTAGESRRTEMAPVVLCFLSGTWAGVCLSSTNSLLDRFISIYRTTVHADVGFHVTVCICTLKFKVAKKKEQDGWGCNVVAWCRNVYYCRICIC
jgi:hypothetical protein